MSYQVTIYSKEEKEAFHEDKSQHGSVVFYLYNPDPKDWRDVRFEGLLRPPSNMVSDKQWFNTCLHVVRTVPRVRGFKDIAGYGLTEDEFIKYYHEERRGNGFHGRISSSFQIKYCGRGRRIAKEMGWSKAYEHWDERYQRALTNKGLPDLIF